MLVNKLFEALQEFEPDIRRIIEAENHPHCSVTISVDPDGATYSWVVSDGIGLQESRSKRIPRAGAHQIVGALQSPPMPSPPPEIKREDT